MKHGHSFAIGILAFALIACGGNGGGGNSKGSSGLSSTPRIEAVLTDPTSDPGYGIVDPLNISTGDGITFQVVSYNVSGDSVTRNVLPAESFRTSDTTGVAGSFTVNGTFQAASTDTGTTNYIVTGTYLGNEYTAFYNVKPRLSQILLRGKVLAEGSNKPVPNAVVKFYSLRNPLDSTSQTVVIASVTTAYDGTFRVSIPAFNDSVSTAAQANAAPKVTFSIDSATLPSGYYPSFTFEGSRFDAGSTLCRATLLSKVAVTDPDTSETAFLPFKSGDRYLINDADSDTSTNGTILLTPKSLYDSKPDADGCAL